jgi:hypothetical protein
MPKIDPSAEYRVAKTWANGHVLIAVIAAAIAGFILGALLL